jgi:DNA-binding MltR family transcriptional regulator
MTRRSTKSQRNAAIQRLRARIAERPDKEALWKVIWDFDLGRPNAQGNDRALALMLGAILEQGIETAILSHLMPVDEKEVHKFFGPPEEAPLTFDLKIRLAFALGVFGPDSRDDITLIRHIRNAFAHTKSYIDFSDNDIIALCAELKYIEKMSWGRYYGAEANRRTQKIR